MSLKHETLNYGLNVHARFCTFYNLNMALFSSQIYTQHSAFQNANLLSLCLLHNLVFMRT